jgi:predicted GIY-YIG superfamily endonuclease
MAYLYVLWAIEDELVKIGISKQPKKRFSTHSGNSSNPLSFMQYKLYKLKCIEDARKLENATRDALTRLGFSYRNKNELFKCSPANAVSSIDNCAVALGIPALKNFPRDFDELDKMGLNFLDLPYYLFDVPTATERRAYFSGAEAALHILGSIDGLSLSAQEIRMIVSPANSYSRNDIEMWRILLDSVAIIVGHDPERSRLVRNAYEKIEREHREAFDAWQETADDDHEEAA